MLSQASISAVRFLLEKTTDAQPALIQKSDISYITIKTYKYNVNMNNRDKLYNIK